MHEGLDRHLGVNEAESGWFGSFTQVVRDDLVDVPVGLLTRDNRLDLHPRTPEATRRRVRARVQPDTHARWAGAAAGGPGAGMDGMVKP